MPGPVGLIWEADSTYDPEERNALYIEAQQLMYDSAWFGYLWYENGNVRLNDRVQTYPAINGSSVTWGSLREREWSIRE